MSEPLILAFAEIFRWDVDFALDIQPQDSFTVLYEERFLDGEKVGDGDILAAEFVNHGKMYRAVRYIDSEGNNQYFTPEGRSMRQTFLRSPVDFRRISSRFRPERWHPILGVKRPHRGVDYAAATGTPIWAAGDGKIAFIGTKGGYGKTIILQHGSRYSTLYGHLSRFHKGLKIGSQVRQGDVIGYVGMTGLATGPHLHYEFRIDGKHVNPITVKLPRPLLLNGKQLAEFRRQTAPLIAQLNTHQNAREMMLTQR
jgi:murein DD-endopeptidase MepM/ murein hydrolase activator NlpD